MLIENSWKLRIIDQFTMMFREAVSIVKRKKEKKKKNENIAARLKIEICKMHNKIIIKFIKG